METGFLRIRYQHSLIPKHPFNMVCALIVLSSVKINFWYSLVLYVNSSVKCLKFAKKCQNFPPILATIFVTIATVKVDLIPYFYTLAIFLVN